jgi:hypothetical protein
MRSRRKRRQLRMMKLNKRSIVSQKRIAVRSRKNKQIILKKKRWRLMQRKKKRLVKIVNMKMKKLQY